MKAKSLLYTFALAACLSACVEDEGSYDIHPINEIEIKGLEESYSKIAFSESLSIKPEVNLTDKGVNESDLEYQWIISNNNVGAEQHHTVIGTEKNLEYKVEVPPGTYELILQVYDKTTGLKWEGTAELRTVSPMVRGFYLFGDKEDGTCGIDFVSMMDKRDTMVVADIFTNSAKIKGAQDLIFTGTNYQKPGIRLWAVSESGTYSLEFGADLGKIDIEEDVNPDKLFFPSIPVTRPLVIKNVYPQTMGAGNMSLSKSARITITENEMFACSMYEPEAYGNPLNRYSAQGKDLFKFCPYLIYQGNSARPNNIFFYDETNHRFAGLNSGYAYATNAVELQDSEKPFYFDQTKYEPVREMIYGENGRGNAGRSYVLMRDANNDYFIYGMAAGWGLSKKFAYSVDKSVATDFDKASHYTFFSEQTIVLYSVGSQLWAYDYQRNNAKMIKDFGAEITFLHMDEHSGNMTTDFVVATYSNSEKGIVSKFTLADDQNEIKVTPHEKEVWKTNLRVVKVEYKNCPH